MSFADSHKPRSKSADQPHRFAGRCVVWFVLIAGLLFLPGCAWVLALSGESAGESQRLFDKAKIAEQNGESQKTGLLLQRATEANPDDTEIRRELARWLLEQGAADAALQQLRFAVESSPDDVEALVQMAGILFDEQRDDDIERPLNAALSLNSEHVEALMLQAALAERQGRETLALETYHRVLLHHPEHMAARLRVAQIQVHWERPAQATPMLLAICDCPDATPDQKVEARWALGVAFAQQQRWQDAAQALAAAAPQRRHMRADDWYQLAYVRYQTGDHNAAWSDLGTALRFNPHHQDSLVMANVLRQQQRR